MRRSAFISLDLYEAQAVIFCMKQIDASNIRQEKTAESFQNAYFYAIALRQNRKLVDDVATGVDCD